MTDKKIHLPKVISFEVPETGSRFQMHCPACGNNSDPYDPGFDPCRHLHSILIEKERAFIWRSLDTGEIKREVMGFPDESFRDLIHHTKHEYPLVTFCLEPGPDSPEINDDFEYYSYNLNA